MICLRGYVFLIVVFLAVPLVFSQAETLNLTYTTIDVPGAGLTGVIGINTAGQMVGWYAQSGNSPASGFLLSGGNFHGQAVAMALDFLAIALTNLATIAERRIDRLVNPDLNQGLTPFLTRDPGVSSGFMMAQVTAAAGRWSRA